jgi:hypothetical protein
MSDTLKAWCHWKKKETGVSEDDLLMVKDIEDVISQVNNWRAKYEKEKEKTEKLGIMLDEIDTVLERRE